MSPIAWNAGRVIAKAATLQEMSCQVHGFATETFWKFCPSVIGLYLCNIIFALTYDSLPNGGILPPFLHTPHSCVSVDI